MVFKSMAVALLLGIGAWAPQPVLTPVAPKVTVAVSNDNWMDVDVFVMVGDTRYRLGTVTTSQVKTFDLPSQAASSNLVRLMADPVGSREIFVSDFLTVTDGDRVTLTVANHLPQSTYAVEHTVD